MLSLGKTGNSWCGGNIWAQSCDTISRAVLAWMAGPKGSCDWNLYGLAVAAS